MRGHSKWLIAIELKNEKDGNNGGKAGYKRYMICKKQGAKCPK